MNDVICIHGGGISLLAAAIPPGWGGVGVRIVDC